MAPDPTRTPAVPSLTCQMRLGGPVDPAPKRDPYQLVALWTGFQQQDADAGVLGKTRRDDCARGPSSDHNVY